MNSDTVFSLLSEEVEHSSNSTMRMSTRLSMLKDLDTPRCAESGPPRNRDSSSPILLSMGVTAPGAGTGPVSSPLVPITVSSMRWQHRQRGKSHFHVTFNQSLVLHSPSVPHFLTHSFPRDGITAFDCWHHISLTSSLLFATMSF